LAENGKIVYIASPYAGDTERNVKVAQEACRYAIERGCVPIAPHLMYPQILDDTIPQERELGLALGRRLLEGSDELWLCGSRISAGMYAELLEAARLHIPHRRIFEAEILERDAPAMGGLTL
jgi:hypothetical protein